MPFFVFHKHRHHSGLKRGFWTGLLGFCMALNASAEENFSFDLSAYQKKPYELNGRMDLMATQIQVNDGSAYSHLAFKGDSAEDFIRYNGELELEGLYRWEQSSVHARTLSQWQDDVFKQTTEHTLQEAYWHTQASERWQFELGKRAVKWGKGYAWNPVGFIERPKNPDEPEQNREGFVLAGTTYTRSFSAPSQATENSTGLLKTVSASLYVLPVNENLNEELALSQQDIDNALQWAAKLYALVGQTDLEFYLHQSSGRIRDTGLSFASNLASNLEIHGDFAWRDPRNRLTINANSGTLESEQRGRFQGLIGLRYLSPNDTTWIAEWLYSPQNPSETELNTFYQFAKAEPNTPEFQLAQLAKSAYSQTPPGEHALYLRISQKDFWDQVYLNAALTGFYNPLDHSYSLTPELSYSGYKNLELRLRTSWLQGSQNTEWGEKLSDLKTELRARLFF